MIIIAITLMLCVACLIGLMAVFPEDATRAAFAIERFRSGLAHKSIVMDDETWHYLDGGPSDAPVVLLLHGFGANKDNWTRFSKKLTDRYHVIAPDLPGFGESARRLERDYSLSAQSDWLHGFAANAEGIIRSMPIRFPHAVGKTGHLGVVVPIFSGLQREITGIAHQSRQLRQAAKIRNPGHA